eukprot:CAMPEP_0185811170 /NCGR_PEP_ID=MMETSP1322-20130828/7649_1 /TAXON_ID=265543 /ORGANISM="Minutocellus polymorphus, Strain RCC2270" /LENGTH=47 /DNA_ID= /DNA_START= /DNA_END= /DNA_ORIENTATION=
MGFTRVEEACSVPSVPSAMAKSLAASLAASMATPNDDNPAAYINAAS